MGDKEILLRCECGAEVMVITYWKPYSMSASEWSVEFMRYPAGLRFKDRVVNAIRVIRNKEPNHSLECTMFDRINALRIRNFLNECIQLDNELKQEIK